MQSTLYAALAALAGLAATSQTAEPQNITYSESTSEICAIYEEQGPDGIQLTAYAAEGVEGEYVFSLRQQGPNGSTQIMQSGDIESGATGPTLLSEVSVDAGGTYSASLQTYTNEGEFTCRVLSR